MNEALYTPNERKLSLLALLFDKPAQRDDIYNRVYGGSSAAAEKSFQRDRHDLKDQGYDIIEDGDFFFLHHDLIPLDVTPCDMTMLRVAASSFTSRDSDHKTVRRTITKLLGGAEPSSSDVQVKLDVPELGILLEIAKAMGQSSPIEVTYQGVDHDRQVRYVLVPASLWTSLGVFYVTGQRILADYGETVDENPVERTLRVSRISSINILQPIDVHVTPSLPPVESLQRHDVTIELAPGHGAHIRERGTQISDDTYQLSQVAFDDALDVLNQLGTSGRTDFQPYLERLTYLSQVGDDA